MIRSYLFVPGDDHRKLDRSTQSPADALIYDLEDAVGPDRKEAARAIVRDHVKARGAGGHHRVVRVNSFATGLTAGDLAVVMQAAPDAILLPKCEGQAEIDRLAAMLEVTEAREGVDAGRTKILALVTETASAVLTASSVRLSHPRLAALTWGGEDLSADVGALGKYGPDGSLDDTFRYARAVCLLAASAAGVTPLDTVYPDFRDAAGFEADCVTAKRMGFLAKTAIHPSQVEVINRVFSPSDAELEWARKVVAAFAAAGNGGVTQLDGKMLDKPHLRLAQRLLGS
ncbi:CoA ester lyase [Vineibacter terrae]|uniref:HpcH/HpaI aldolase/citrate lyase family protein n=1 Tax=Vineibacter terrae TaxID=2586908 RepID=UPI002E2F24F7|nr:CoA ester lyase [Vineibacter terrae]HEX2885476.1 CoA ester lyase [Vineibacter terrae]